MKDLGHTNKDKEVEKENKVEQEKKGCPKKVYIEVL